MDIPNAGHHHSVTKKGHLQKLSSRSFPYIPHPWKRKFCVLVKGQLFYYEKEDSKGADKGCGVINLEYYDQVVEAPAKECKKATNVFVLTSQDRSFFDPGRHLFSADCPKELQEWMRVLKRAIEQIRNNNRTATAVAGSFLNLSTPRPSKGAASKGEAGGGASKPLGGGGGKGEGGAGRGRDKKKDGVEEDGQGKRRKENEVENKENLVEWTDSKERKQKYSDTSLRRRKGNPSSRSMDESSLVGTDNSGKGVGGTNSFGRKKGAGVGSDTEPNSGPNSLGRKLKLGGKAGKSGPDFNRFGGGQAEVEEGMMFGSLGRQSKVEGTSAKGSASGVSGDSGCSGSGGSGNVERRKRKADDDGYEEEEGAVMETSESGHRLESVTKHRVKGPAGRRMPQNRRTQHLLMKQRASSLSALAHNADAAQSQDNPAARSATPSKREPSSCSTVPEETEPSVELLGTCVNKSEANDSMKATVKKGGGLLGDDLKQALGKRAEFRVSNLMEEVMGKLSNGVASNGCDGNSAQAADIEKEGDANNPINLEDVKASQVGDGDGADPGDSTIINVSNNNINNNRSACDNKELPVYYQSNGSVGLFVDCFACRCCFACRDSSGKCFCDSLANSTPQSPAVPVSPSKNSKDFEVEEEPVDYESEDKIVVQGESDDTEIESDTFNKSENADTNDPSGENCVSVSEVDDEIISKENDKNKNISADISEKEGFCSKCGTELKESFAETKSCNGIEESIKIEVPSPTVDSEKVQLRKASTSSGNVDPTARIETLAIDTFDDIDEALFFKSSRVLYDDIQTSNGTSDDQTPSKSKKGKTKKHVTMDDDSIKKTARSDSDASKSRLSRFRKTLNSFRRVRLRTDSSLTDDHPDEVTETSNSSFCVVL